MMDSLFVVDREGEGKGTGNPAREGEAYSLRGCPSMKGILPISQSSFSDDYPLTGWGEKYANCGTFFTVGCLNVDEHKGMNLDGVSMEGKVYLERKKLSCHRPLCPTCWTDWANREVKKAKRRLEAFVLKGRSLKPIHLTVSVPVLDWGLSLIEKRKKVYRALKMVHCLGGMLIFHPKRQKENGEWFYSPHFHVIGYGWIVDVRANYVHSGYIVKNIGVRKTVEGTIFYQLSHCGISPEHHTVTWFGALSYGKLHVSKEEVEKSECPICGDPLHRLTWVGKGECPIPDVEGVGFFDEQSNWIRLPRRWQSDE